MNRQKKSEKNRKSQSPGAKTLLDYCTSSPAVYFIIFLFIFLIYGQILSFFLGKLDEPDILLVNMRFLSDFGNLKEAFFRDAFFSTGDGTFYRPIQNISFMVDAHLSGSKAWGYYLSNMVIHAITCSLIFNLLNLLGNSKRSAFMMAMFFAASPLFVQAVAWAPSRGDLLIGMFGVLSFIFFIRFITSKRYVFLVLNLLSMLLAVFSKETALLLPVLYFLYYFLIGKENKISIRQLILLISGYALIIALYLFLRQIVVVNAAPSQVFGILPLLKNLRTLPEFISKFILPLQLSPMPAFGWFQTIAGILLIAAIALFAIKKLQGQSRMVYFGFLWFLLFAIPGMMYSHPLGNAAYNYLEHRAYLPLIGIVIILYFVISHLEANKAIQHIFLYFFLVTVAFGTYAHTYSLNYTNPLTFYNKAIETNPKSAVAYYNRGEITVFHEKDYQHAISDFDHALAIRPDYAKAIVNRGICKQFMGDTLGALRDCEKGAEMDPDLFIARKNMAVIKNQLGLKTEALKEWNHVLRISPDYYQGYNERGNLRYQLKDFESAERDFNRCLQLNNRYPEAFLNRGILYYETGYPEKACRDWNSAAELGSNDALSLINEYCSK